MQSSLFFTLIIAFVVLDYIVSLCLDLLNFNSKSGPIPQNVQIHYDSDKYEKSVAYQKTRKVFGLWSHGVSFLLTLGLLYFGGFGWINSWVTTGVSNPFYASGIFFLVLFLGSDLLSLPFQLYSTFVIEAKFGFNRTTLKVFVLDKIKGYLLSVVIGGGMLYVFLWLIGELEQDFWLYFWLFAVGIMLVANAFYATLILPLFNKLSPLEKGSLKTKITDYCNSIQFPMDNIFVINGSKRSTKANAFFSGLGKKKKIVLYDTLIDNHEEDEIVAVLAHEVGHFKKKHIVWSMLFSFVQMGVLLYLASWVLFNPDISLALGAPSYSIQLNMIAFGMLFSPLSNILGLIMNVLSRKNEFEADEFAKKSYNGKALQTALIRLSADSLSNLFPHPWYVYFHHSHPPLLKRLQALEE